MATNDHNLAVNGPQPCRNLAVVQQGGNQFASIRPNAMREVTLLKGQSKVGIALPDDLANRNVLVEVVGAGKTKSAAYYADAMDVQFTKNNGSSVASACANPIRRERFSRMILSPSSRQSLKKPTLHQYGAPRSSTGRLLLRKSLDGIGIASTSPRHTFPISSGKSLDLLKPFSEEYCMQPIARKKVSFASHSRLAALLALTMVFSTSLQRGYAQASKDDRPRAKDREPIKTGVTINEPKAYKGYTLYGPMKSTTTYLIDMEGRIVRTWESEYVPALSAQLLPNGHLLRPCFIEKNTSRMPGAGGRIQEFDWDGKLIWDFAFPGKDLLPHHDIAKLPNGNILMIASERKTAHDAIDSGRRPATVREGHLMADAIIEIKPTGKTTGDVVWEWHVWDHLVQDHDKAKANYGRVSAHPELIDINFGELMWDPLLAKKDDFFEGLRGLGYLGGPPGPLPPGSGGPGGGMPPLDAEWTHVNSVAYNAELEQVVLSVHSFHEVWIIDHGTTKTQAASHKGGRQDKGGDLLYRWGNPRAYRSGTNADQRLFYQHNAQWIPKGSPGEGHLLVFNNGNKRPDGSYSSVDEIVTPVTKGGGYTSKSGLAFGPDKAVWSYTAPNKGDFFAMVVSGVQRLPNGNTLICVGTENTVFEVTAEKDVVWRFKLPEPPVTFFPAVPAPLQDILKLTPAQRQQVDDLQKDIDAHLDKLLTSDQKKWLSQIPDRFGPGDPRSIIHPGGPGDFGPQGGLFRSYRYGVDYPGLVGKDLKPAKSPE